MYSKLQAYDVWLSLHSITFICSLQLNMIKLLDHSLGIQFTLVKTLVFLVFDLCSCYFASALPCFHFGSNDWANLLASKVDSKCPFVSWIVHLSRLS